jgi:hypothetical protein
MVFSDYEIGNSTRIEKLRSSQSAYSQRLFDAKGGYLGVLIPFSTFAYTFCYCLRTFREYSKSSRYLGAGLIALLVGNQAAIFTSANYGSISEFALLTSQPHKIQTEIEKQQAVELAKYRLRAEENTKIAEESLGKI